VHARCRLQSVQNGKNGYCSTWLGVSIGKDEQDKWLWKEIGNGGYWGSEGKPATMQGNKHQHISTVIATVNKYASEANVVREKLRFGLDVVWLDLCY